jgi:hypothetical protein
MADPTLDDIGRWILDNQDKQHTPDFETMANAYKHMSAQRGAAGADVMEASPWETVDVNQPAANVRAAIAALPDERNKDIATRAWADAYVRRENEQGGVGHWIDERARALARGTPVGSWLDEANAGTSALANKLSGGRFGAPYDESVAYQRARDRIYAEQHPWENLGENVGGAIASLPLSTVRGAGFLGNLGLNTALGAIYGAGETNRPDIGTAGEAWDRAKHAAVGGTVAGGLTTLLYPLARLYSRYATTDPAIDQAAGSLGKDLPFFTRAADPKAQAFGRQFAQMNPGSKVAAGWDRAYNAPASSIDDVARSIVGAESATAPYYAGRAVRPGMERAAENATQQMGALARQTSDAMPAAARYDMPITRSTVGDLVGERRAAGSMAPWAGLDEAANLSTQPHGSTFPGMARQITELGQDIGRPDIVPRPLPRADQSRVYSALRADQGDAVEAALGSAGRSTYEQNLVRQADLAELRDEIARAVGNRQPEALISMAHRAANVRGGGTRIDELGTIVNALNPAEREQLAAGVLANINNAARGSPGGIAGGLNAMPAQTRDMLFQPGTQLGQQATDIRTLAQRLGEIQGMGHVGSAKTKADTWGEEALRGLTGSAGKATAALAAGRATGIPGIGPALASLSAVRDFKNFLGKAVGAPYALRRGLPPAAVGPINTFAIGVPRVGGDWIADRLR